MWEPYLRAELPAPTDDDRARLESIAGGPLPPDYWELALAHQGEGLDPDLVQYPAFESLILLLPLSPERLDKALESYSIIAIVRDVMPRYPAGLLPFADDTGGNLWAFDYRDDPASPSVVFIDHELTGEAGVTAQAPDFAAMLNRIGLTSD